MKTMILAAAAVLSLGMGAAFAGDGDGPVANTQFTQIPGVLAQAPVQSNSAIAQNGSGTYAYVTSDRGTAALFPPNQNQGANS